MTAAELEGTNIKQFFVKKLNHKFLNQTMQM